MPLLQQSLGAVSAPGDPSAAQVQFTLDLAALFFSPLAWHSWCWAGVCLGGGGVTPRAALIGISAPVALMGCFPGTELPCLGNVLAAQPQPWVQPCPGCSWVGASDLGAPHAPSRAGSSSQCPQTGKKGDISPAKQSICCCWNRNWEQDFEGRLFFPAAYNNVTVRFSATVSRTRPRSLRTMARLPFLSWLLEFCCTSPQRSIFLSILEIMCIVAVLLEKLAANPPGQGMWLPTIAWG